MTLAWPTGRQLRDALAQSATPAQPCGRAELSHMLMSLHLDVGVCMNAPLSLTPSPPARIGSGSRPGARDLSADLGTPPQPPQYRSLMSSFISFSSALTTQLNFALSFTTRLPC